ncbi:hypothetical protein D3C87_1626030 [compost metagenome]
MVFPRRTAKRVIHFAALYLGVFIEFQRARALVVGEVVTQRIFRGTGSEQPLHAIAAGVEVEYLVQRGAIAQMDFQSRQVAHFGDHGMSTGQGRADFAQAFASATIEVAFGVVGFVFTLYG